MCPRASIINRWGTKYPVRLENCIETVNWLERLAEEQSCKYIINLGDFFDKPDLSSETITAVQDIQWSNIMHYHIVGNHDASNSSLIFNSTNALMAGNHNIITEPQLMLLDDCDILFLPYVVECDRKPLDQYLLDKNGKYIDTSKPRVILSHNDINGIQLGPVVSRTGFTLEELEANAALVIHGHLHNGQNITDKVITLGNITGKDFGEDAFKYGHSVAILDTETLNLTYIENPYAFNFYKIQIETEPDITQLFHLKQRSVVSIKCDTALADRVRQTISELPNIFESRIIVTKKYEETDTESSNLDLSVDHLAKFIDCCRASIGASNLLEEELAEICK
jgi:DNA repair exonuclease SbcCD nuclease subunit